MVTWLYNRHVFLERDYIFSETITSTISSLKIFFSCPGEKTSAALAAFHVCKRKKVLAFSFQSRKVLLAFICMKIIKQ